MNRNIRLFGLVCGFVAILSILYYLIFFPNFQEIQVVRYFEIVASFIALFILGRMICETVLEFMEKAA